MWPENYPAVRLFGEMRTQWRTDFGGRTGLDYTALFARIAMFGLEPAERDALFHDVQVMEGAALEHWDAQRPIP